MADQMDPESRERKEAEALIAYLKKDWEIVAEKFKDSNSIDSQLLRLRAVVENLDAKDPDQVRRADELLDRHEPDLTNPLLDLSHLQTTTQLFRRVLQGPTPLEFDRKPLADSLLHRLQRLLSAIDQDSPFRPRVLGVAAEAASILRDDPIEKSVRQEIETLSDPQSKGFFDLGKSAPSSEEVEELRKKEAITPVQAVLFKAAGADQRGNQEEVERILREGLYTLSEMSDRARILQSLVRHLHREQRLDEAEQLIEQTPLREPDRWLLRSQVARLQEGESAEQKILESGADRFPLNPDLLERLTHLTLRVADQKTDRTKYQVPDDHTPPSEADTAVERAEQFLSVLPSRSVRRLYAEALLVAQRYEQLFDITESLDEAFEPRASELNVWALNGMGRTDEAADLLVETFEESPDQRLAVNVSALLLKGDRPDEVISLFDTSAEDIEAPGLLMNLARAHMAADPFSTDASSRAFDLLKAAYELDPDQKIAEQAWKAARGARREREAHHFFAAMTEGASKIQAHTAEDLEKASSSSGFQLVEFTEGLDPLIEWKKRFEERNESLNTLNRTHSIAYTDLFRFGGHPWENWAKWTTSFKRVSELGSPTEGRYSVLVDWPTSVFQNQRRFQEADRPLLADLSVLLTLGVLDTDTIDSILISLGAVHILEGTLDDLEAEILRLESDLQIGRAQPYEETVSLLREADAIVSYTDEVEKAAPDDKEMGAVRVDIGAALLENGIYVTDLGNVQEWSDAAQSVTFSSSQILSSLNRAGRVTAQEAKSAAEAAPDTFAGWDEEDGIDLPASIFFNPFTLLDWVETGLVNALDDRLRVGPWSWTHLAESSNKQESQRTAYERATKVRGVLQERLQDGTVVPVSPAEVEDPDEPSVQGLWKSALEVIKTAEEKGWQVWADDRFYALLLWQGGPLVTGQEIQQLREPFVDWAADTPPLTTFCVVDRLSKEGEIATDTAQRVASCLYEVGYRPSHPLLLDYFLKQYQLPEESLSPPFSRLAASIKDFPHYLPDSVAAERAEGFSRVASAEAGEELIRRVWMVDGLSHGQRRALSDAFLDAIEDVFASNSPSPASSRSNLTPILFWRGVAVALRTIPVASEDDLDRRRKALRWLGDAAGQRAMSGDIVRLLEDNVLKSLEYSAEAAQEVASDADVLDLSGKHAFVDLIPLVDSKLVHELDPLLRRSIGIIADIPGEARLDTVHSISFEGTELTLTVSEEEEEERAVEVLAHPDIDFQRFLRATSLAFGAEWPVPDDWSEAGVPEDAEIPVNIRCSLFNLLGRESVALRDNIVRLLIHQLSQLDPSLAAELVTLRDSLTSEDRSNVQKARKKLAIRLLESGYFDLQRDLVHAVRRYRDYSSDRLNRFLGFVGEDKAQLLEENEFNILTQRLNGMIVPRSHFSARVFLTNWASEETDLQQLAELLANSGGEDEGQGSDGQFDWDGEKPSFETWVANKVEVAEEAADPFVAAWALRQVMMGLSAKGEDIAVPLDDEEKSLTGWVQNYILSAFHAEDYEDGRLAKNMANRRRLAASALRLAGHACSGQNHVSNYNDEDPLSEWLDHSWLFTTKLQLALLGFEGTCELAAQRATSAVRDLGLDDVSPGIPDYFDPFAFGFEEADLGMTLTLTAILQALREESGSLPPWWTDEVQDAVENLSTSPPSGPVSASRVESETTDDPNQPRWGNRLDLQAPLRIHPLRKEVLDLVDQLIE